MVPTILINVSTLTYMHQCNNKIHTDGNLSENINKRFGILGGPLPSCRSFSENKNS